MKPIAKAVKSDVSVGSSSKRIIFFIRFFYFHYIHLLNSEFALFMRALTGRNRIRLL